MKKTKEVRAWAIVDSNNMPVGCWTRLVPGKEVCVMTVFRFRELALAKRNATPDGAPYKVIRVSIVPVPKKRKRK